MLGSLAKYFSSVSQVRKLLFALVHLPEDLPDRWKIALTFANGSTCVTAEQVRVLCENLQDIDSEAFATDLSLTTDILQVPRDKPYGVVLISDKKSCQQCGSILLLRKDRPSSLVIYNDSMGSIPGTHFHKYCSNKRCTRVQYYGYHTSNSGLQHSVHFDPDWKTLAYFVSSRETAFDMKLLYRFDSQILLGQQSFKQCASVYNHLHLELEKDGLSTPVVMLQERQKLDRRRIEDAFFQYAVLKVASWYSEHFSLCELPLHSMSTETTALVTKTYHGLFMSHYSKHRCEQPGCGEVLVFDGNMKNYRDVCFATNAGVASFKGLEGQVRIGCQNTPAFKCRYCPLHMPTAGKPLGDGASLDSISSTQDEQIALIAGKRTTRNSTLYQVVWLGRPQAEYTWEQASNLPATLVKDYEDGKEYDVEVESFTSGGETFRTLFSKASDRELTSPSQKRPKVDTTTSTSGVLCEADEDHGLTCNTVKDRTRLNYKTAGILMGAWPCGKIVMLGELYGSESLSQVYGQIHTLMQENTQQLNGLRFLCYDDGCHLKKFACNAKRRDSTTTSKWISSLNIVVDKLHFRGHVDKWCQQHCNPNDFDDLKKVDTEVCEQVFSWMSKYARITQHMNRQHFLFYLLYLCDSRNRM